MNESPNESGWRRKSKQEWIPTLGTFLFKDRLASVKGKGIPSPGRAWKGSHRLGYSLKVHQENQASWSLRRAYSRKPA